MLSTSVSLWGYVSAENKKSENYDYILATAESSADYYEAIITDPTRTDAYLGTDDFKGLVDFLITDGELTTEENAVLQKLKGGLETKDVSGYSSTVNVMQQLQAQNPEGYKDVCYSIGEAYLFYYTVGVEKDKYSTAATWFQYAGEGYPVAKVYCDISEWLDEIGKYAKADQFGKLYESYTELWEKIKTLQTDAEEYDDDLKLRVWNEIVNMISNNASEFSEVSSTTELINVLNTINRKCDSIENTFLQQNIANMRKNIETTTIKHFCRRLQGAFLMFIFKEDNMT